MNSNPTNKNSRESYSKKDVENRITDPTTLSVDEQIDKTFAHKEIYSRIFDVLRTPNQQWKGMKKVPIELLWGISGLIRQVCEEVIKEITINQNGMFDDDAGNACWYVDDLDRVLRTKLNNLLWSDK